MSIEKYFNETRNVALCSDFHKEHVGCIAVYKGKIIARGCNSAKTHPLQMHYNRFRANNNVKSTMLPKVHAEMKCISLIKNLDIDFKKVKLFVYRVRLDQPYGMARPCAACMNAIMDLGICDIYYTTDIGYVHERIMEREERRNYGGSICRIA